MFFAKTSHWGIPGFVFVLWTIISFAARDMQAASFRLVISLLALCLTLFSAFTPVPAQAADSLYIYSGGGGGGGAPRTNGYHGGGGGGGYVGAVDGGAGAGGAGANWNSAGSGGGNANASLNGGDSTQTQGGIGGGTGPYAGGAGAVFSGSLGGSGGNGGSIINPVILSTQFNHITMGAGQGGDGGAGDTLVAGRGGNGGDIALTLNADAMVLGNIILEAGNGGKGGYSSGLAPGGEGGTGGSVNLGASSSLTVFGDVALTSGINGIYSVSGSSAGGTGGGVYFGYTDAGLTASNYTLVFADNGGSGHTVGLAKNDGEAKFNASGLALEAGAAGAVNTVNFTGVADYDAFTIGNISLGGYSALNLDAASLSYAWGGNLFVSGKSNTLQNISGGTDLSGKIITFNLPTDLTAGDTLLGGSNTKLTGANIAMTVAAAGGQPGALNGLNAGDKVILISGIDHSTWSGSQAEATTSGGAVDYTFALGSEQLSGIWSLVSTLKSEIFDDGKAHNALMSASAMNLLLAEGGDRAASLPGKFVPSGQGQGQANNMQYGSFMDMGAGHYEMKTGSHVESDSFHLLAGPGLRFNHAGGAKTDLGLFFETGWGNFDTYNSFYRGDGDTSYSGAGLLARHDMACGLYGETSLRVGHAKSEYDSRYDTGYDLSSTYYGGHLGLGYVLQVSEPGSLDFSAKLLYTGLQGDSDTNSAGGRMKVDDTDSTRTQLGVKYEHQLGDSFNAFTRVAWDYEFDGKNTGDYNQYEISNTDPSGSTGIGEIGLQWQAAQNFSIGLATHGLTGKREGYGGDLSLRLAF